MWEKNCRFSQVILLRSAHTEFELQKKKQETLDSEGVKLGLKWTSGVGHVQEVFLRWGPTPVPAAGSVGAADAGVLPSLLAIKAVIQQPVSPQALIVSCRGTRDCVTGVDLRREEVLVYSIHSSTHTTNP